MEGRKESKYNLAGICANCGKPVKIELTIATELIETDEGKSTEEEYDDIGPETKAVLERDAKGTDVRPADTKGATGTTSSTFKSADSGKSKANKRSGSKAK